MSRPRVFIVESLKFEDEDQGLHEGELISKILTLSGSRPKYMYIRTKQELEEVLDIFEDSKYRYLHFSCHGNSKGIGLTLDYLDFEEFGDLVRPYIDDRRVFFSSCKVVNPKLAKALFRKDGCYSVVGPNTKVNFDRAAIFWASFYHLALRDEARSMKMEKIKEDVNSLRQLFEISVSYFSLSSQTPYFKKIELESRP